MTIRYLLLGEGDFTYSFDMCRYFYASLSSSQSSSSSSLALPSSSPSSSYEQNDCQHDDEVKDEDANPPNGNGTASARHDNATRSYSITCTGVDTHEELTAKYKDIDFVLQRIRQCRLPSSSSSSANVGLSTRILHGINAVEITPPSSSSSSPRYHHVIFHHPHLGTEDAARHSRFLHHFFHAAVHRWLIPAENDARARERERDVGRNGGLLYLTLVTGQCRRWKCLDAANERGLVLLRRGAFRPPPPPPAGGEEGETTRYRPRRHQSGKSFAKRRRRRRLREEDGDGEGEAEGETEGESETLVFGRACDWNDSSHVSGRDYVGFFPWEIETRGGSSSSSSSASSSDKPSHSCRYCDKSFHEARSLKNHLRCCHPDSEEVRAALSKRERKRSNNKRKNAPTQTQTQTQTQRQGEKDSMTTDQSNSTKTQPLSETNTHHRHHRKDDEIVEGPPWICKYCNEHTDNDAPVIPPRVFPHKQALLDHQRAKHFGDHVDIKPDWCNKHNHHHQHNRKHHVHDNSSRHLHHRDHPSSNDDDHHPALLSDSPSITESPHGSCPICNLPFLSEQMKLHHEREFLPSSSSPSSPPPSSSSGKGSSPPSNTSSSSRACSYCSKPFREVRARRQHENFCSERLSLGGVGTTISST
mmetsp:Transcript_9407/g.19562  ORF Transcript_9407/g.19562 Transcript_9407/m.19562 type:complete len:644 (-) Transcript_9407:91-2022(-)